ncbi:carbohydrate esterase family 16 protein [Peniophora sp. CONT]|nr:carbohydrate esterase family 16 protein [Peniophora sp. CONT]
MAHALVVLSCLAASLSAAATSVPHRADTNDGIHLAINPSCGSFGGNFTNVNAGLKTSAVKTFVVFGDSYTDGGAHDGGPLPAAIVPANSTRAGGRVTNGPVWVEWVANATKATLMDYARSGAVVNHTLWPSKSTQSDFIEHTDLFLSQNHKLDPASTVYVSFYGINDYSASSTDGDNLPTAAAQLLARLQVLASPPTNAKQFLILDDYGRGTHAARGDAFKQAVFDGVGKMSKGGAKVAFVDFAPLWDAVLGANPGFKAFGYTSDDSCFDSTSPVGTEGECTDPAHTFYWLHGHPSKETHKIMGDYVLDVLNC